MQRCPPPFVPANPTNRRVAEEHHISTFDPGAFFTLHDFDNDGTWSGSEILKTYGLEHDSNRDVSPQQKDDMLRRILDLIDENADGVVSREEFLRFMGEKGQTLPDLGTGPGHHWDIETEYEIHHWEM